MVTGPWLVRRCAWSLGVLLAVALVTFALAYVLPVDPALASLPPHAPPQAVAHARTALGLDRPLVVQLADYVWRLLHGDFGQSYSLHRDVLPLIAERLPATLELAIFGLIAEVGLGVSLGVLSVVRRGQWAARAADVAAVVAVGAPSIWVGYVLLYLVAFVPQQALGLEVFPVGGGYRWLDLRFVLLPALTLAMPGIGTCARLTRVALAEELRRDYVQTARAKGISDRGVVLHHALPNALGPVISEVGLDLGSFLGGVVVVETVFSWPGVGQLAFRSIDRHDVPLIMATVLLGAIAVVIANLVADVVRLHLDPQLAAAAGA